MARDINLDKPLSEADVAYMQQRPWMEEQAVRLGYDLEELYASASSPVDDQSDDQSDDQVETYADWKKAELFEELKERGLSTVGNKDELIARLLEDDAEDNEESDDEDEDPGEGDGGEEKE